MTGVALYSRVSRPDERDILVNQVAALRSYCADRGFTVVREFSEIASGGSDGRSALNDLLSEASLRRGRPFDGVVFTSLSRVTRGGVGAALEILRRLEAAGCQWWFVEQPILDFDDQSPKLARDIVLAVIAAVDEDYRARVSRATKAAYVKRKALADANGTPLRWGRRKATPRSAEEPVG
ncbi:MAG: recombinase family protein, partial [Nitrososphaerota archaeon]|jgi:DNA invertase Pin-like site-specific DNA recombinase|nr:recombinase family protein [Nitrososphaerota archaeon]